MAANFIVLYAECQKVYYTYFIFMRSISRVSPGKVFSSICIAVAEFSFN